MIISFGDKNTEKIWTGEKVKYLPEEIQQIGRRKLRMLDSSLDLKDLMVPPGNRLEKLSGDLADYYSIRINDKWRIIFKWINSNAEETKILNYHD